MKKEKIVLDPSKYYEEAKAKYTVLMAGKLPSTLNRKGKIYMTFPLLEEEGIHTWEDLQREAELIDDKESKLSATARDIAINLHTHCTLQCLNEYQAQTEKKDD